MKGALFAVNKKEFDRKKAELMQKAEALKNAMAIKSPEELQKATECSVRGFRAVLFGEKAFRTDLLVFVAATIVAFLLPVTWCERALMVYTVFIALVAEIINTAIETVIDRISTEWNVLSGKAKDIGSSVVFVAFLGAGITWTIILSGVFVRFFCSRN